jgi:anthranilate phosphoribosyltransferase
VRSIPEIVKHVGRGARLAKDLDFDEARDTMSRLSAADADPVQLGGFLIALRMKGESADELAGFTAALRAHVVFDLAGQADVDVDLHADGREGRPSLTLASACVAAACGVKVLVRGAFSSNFAKNDTGDSLASLGLDAHAGAGAQARALAAGVAVMDVAGYAPRIAALLALRERLGVRTCVNSAVKLLDPAGTRRQLVGIFHGPYHAPVAGAAARLGAVRAAIVQAPGGVPEISPDKPTRVSLVDAGVVGEPAALATPRGPALPEADERLVEAVLGGAGPAGATHATLLGASLMLWAAGRVDSPSGPSPAASEALASGAAARVLDAVRLCYRL